MRKPHKFNAQPTEVDGVRFASKKEAKRYRELKLLEKAGEISEIQLQPRFSLVVPVPTGEYEYIGSYIADFTYEDKAGQQVVEDVKGVRTPVYRLKKKMVEAIYGVEIREI